MVPTAIKRILTSLLLIATLCTAQAINFRFRAGVSSSIPASSLSRYESTLGSLLTAIDNAGRSGGALELGGINIQPEARDRLMSLWSTYHFVVKSPTVQSKIYTDHQGYQVRDIDITVKPIDNLYHESLNRQICISFNKSGQITGVRPQLETQESMDKFFAGARPMTEDFANRQEILKFVEDFRCYYEEKNVKALDAIFSDDAIIITGSMMTKKKRGRDGWQISKDVTYKHQTKPEYLKNLQSIFQNNRRISCKFDKITIKRHGSLDHVYGVTLHQDWATDRYKDQGWVFLLWDFSDPTHPQIHVRTWQPNEMVAGDPDNVYDLQDFFISSQEE